MPRRPALAALLLAAPLAAQQPAPDSARRVEPVLVIGTRAATTAGGAAAVVVRPDSLRLPAPPAPTIEQVLRQTPFVLVRQNSRGEVELSVRGSDSRQAALMLDGLPLTLGWDHRTDASLLPSTGVRRVALVRGTSSLLAGVNAIGGVIAVELNDARARDPELALGAGLDEYAGRVASGVGGAPLAVRGGTLTVRGGASVRERAGLARSRAGGDPGDDGDARLRTNTDLRQADGFAAARWDAPGGAHVGLTATAFDASRGVAPELHLASPRWWRIPAASRRLAVLSAGTGPVATALGHGRAEASVGAHRGSVEIESFTARDLATLATRELGDERVAAGRAVAEHSLPRAGRLRVGGTWAEVRYRETLDAQRATASASRYRQRLASAGAEVELPIAGRLVASAGLARDVASTPESGGRTPLGALSRGAWRVGVTAAASDAVRMHASASRRARFPALRELYSGALERFEPNPALRPERLTGMEAGATLDAAAIRGLTLQAVAFHHRLEDAVVRVTLPSRRFRRVNRDEVRSTGLELLAGWRSARGVSVGGDLLAQRVRVHDATLPDTAAGERHAEHQPSLRGSLDVGVPLPLGVRATALARHAGRQWCAHPDLGRQVPLASTTAGDVALARPWTLGRGLLRTLRATVALDNVTDATAWDQCGLPQPGRTLRVGVELQ